MIPEWAFAEENGFSVEVDDRGYLIVSDSTGDTHEVGPLDSSGTAAENHDEACEYIADAIKDFAYGIASRLAKKLEASDE